MVLSTGTASREKRPTFSYTLHFFLTSASFSSTITLLAPHFFFVGIHCEGQLVVSGQDLCQSCVVVHRVTCQAEQGGPQSVTALI